MLHILGTIHHVIVIYGTHVSNDSISMHFLHFYKILTFLVVTGVKGQKKAQNNIKFCPLHSISQEPCIKWLSFMVHIYKMIISSGVFFFFFFWFKILIFWLHRWVKGQKQSRMIKNSVCRTLFLRNHTSYDCHLWCKCIKW